MTLRARLPEERDWLDEEKLPSTAGMENEDRLPLDLVAGRAYALRAFLEICVVSGLAIIALRLLAFVPQVTISAAFWAAVLVTLALAPSYLMDFVRKDPWTHLVPWYVGAVWVAWATFVWLKLGALMQAAYVFIFLLALTLTDALARAAARNFVFWRTCEGFLDETRDRLREEFDRAGCGTLRLVLAWLAGFFLLEVGGPLAFWGFAAALVVMWLIARLRQPARPPVGLVASLAWQATVVLLAYNREDRNPPGAFQPRDSLVRSPAGRIVVVALMVAMLHVAFIALDVVMWPRHFNWNHVPLSLTIWFFHLAAYIFLPLGFYLAVLVLTEGDALAAAALAADKQEEASAARGVAEEEGGETW